MYKVIGVDGKEYGPVSLELLTQWAAQGRINSQTRVLPAGASEWKAAVDVPELASLFAAPSLPLPGTSSPPPGGGYPQGTRQGLAITSFVLGLVSLVCFGFLSGIPAVICGHVARGKAKREPAIFGGAGFALAGLIMGYVGILVTLLALPAMLLPALGKAKERAQSINCINQLKQIGLAYKVWAIDHNDEFPFNVSTNAGGTLELAEPDADGVDPNPQIHLMVLSNELSTTKILVCPADQAHSIAMNFQALQAMNVSYRMRSGTNVTEANPNEVLATCPIHNHTLRVDGSVESGLRKGMRRGGSGR
jgi:hypothetical protein